MVKTILSLGLAMGVFLGTAQAQAQVKSAVRSSSGDLYEFKDELLNSGVSFPHGAILRVNIKPLRTRLLRPRLSFVGEMLKSVEQM